MAEDKRNQVQLPHHLVLEDRRALTGSGVSGVGSLYEITGVIYTEMGERTVKGPGVDIYRPEGGKGGGLVVREPRERDGERQLAYRPLRGAV